MNVHANFAFSQGHSATSQRIFLSDYIMITPYELKTSLIERGALIVLAHHLQSMAAVDVHLTLRITPFTSTFANSGGPEPGTAHGLI